MIAAQHIKDLRLEHNFTQSYLAHELNVSQKTYSNLECGKTKIKLEHLFKLSALYKIEIVKFIQIINTTDSKTISSIAANHPKLSNDDIFNGVNTNLPFELINQLKARIDDLNRLVNSKDTRIENLLHKIKVLEAKPSHLRRL